MALFGILTAASLADGSDALVREAVNEEKALGEISGRLEEIQERQDESNVYSRNEIERTGMQGKSIDEVRTEQYRTILDGLSKAEDDANSAGLQQAGAAYQEALDILEKSFRAEALRRALAESQILARQEELRNETEKLAEELAQKEEVSDEDLERLADLAEKQETLSKDIAETLQKPMQEAADAIQEMNLDQARQKQDQVLAELRQRVGEEMNNEQAENAESLENMRRMEESLSSMEQQLRESIEQQQPMSDQERQEMAMKMDEAARDLAKNELPEAAEATEQAMEQLMQPNDPAAREQLRKALAEVQQQKQQMAQQRQQMQQEPQEQASKEEKDRPADGIQEGKRNVAAAGDEWQAGLPERERAALLSARQAKFDGRMDEAVKRYFTELAQ
jgi:DNA repair exonuclease SbcCD ATPase subunit